MLPRATTWALKKALKDHVSARANGLKLARLGAVGLLLSLFGCVTVENSLSQNNVASMKLTGVTVNYAPDSFMQWEGWREGLRHLQGHPEVADLKVHLPAPASGRRPLIASPLHWDHSLCLKRRGSAATLDPVGV